MTDLLLARMLHILAIVHWIGGVFFVTSVILPAVRRMASPERQLDTFEEIEGRFSLQAKLSVIVAGASGFYLTHKLDLWHRFADAQFWWMHAMLGVWLVFAIVLFVAEPLFLHAWFRAKAKEKPKETLLLVQRLHIFLLALSLLATGGAMLGAHGWVF